MTDWKQTFPWTAAFLRFLWPEGPARRKRWIRFAVAVLVLVAAHAALTILMRARLAPVLDDFVARYGPMHAAAHRPAAVEDAANKARAVRAAAEVMVVPPVHGGGKPHETFGTWTDKDLSAADRELIRSVVTENAPALSLLDLAAGRSGSDWDLHYEWGVEMDVPPLLRIIQLTKLNAAAGRLALEDGRVDDAVTAVRRGAAIAASLENEPVLIVQIVRLAIDRINRTLARGIVAGAALRPEQLAALRSALPDEQPRRALQQAWVVETKALDAVMRGESLDSFARARGHRSDAALGIAWVRAVARPYLLNEERIWLQLMMRRIEALGAPRHARSDPGPGPEVRSWNVLVRVVGGEDPGPLVERADLGEAGALLAGAALAVESARVETGRAPASLAELVPSRLPALPVDPLTGGSFVYETDGDAWRVRSAFEWSTLEAARMYDPVLDWSRGAS